MVYNIEQSDVPSGMGILVACRVYEEQCPTHFTALPFLDLQNCRACLLSQDASVTLWWYIRDANKCTGRVELHSQGVCGAVNGMGKAVVPCFDGKGVGGEECGVHHGRRARKGEQRKVWFADTLEEEGTITKADVNTRGIEQDTIAMRVIVESTHQNEANSCTGYIQCVIEDE